jgi:hypothetical protein
MYENLRNPHKYHLCSTTQIPKNFESITDFVKSLRIAENRYIEERIVCREYLVCESVSEKNVKWAKIKKGLEPYAGKHPRMYVADDSFDLIDAPLTKFREIISNFAIVDEMEECEILEVNSENEAESSESEDSGSDSDFSESSSFVEDETASSTKAYIVDNKKTVNRRKLRHIYSDDSDEDLPEVNISKKPRTGESASDPIMLNDNK